MRHRANNALRIKALEHVQSLESRAFFDTCERWFFAEPRKLDDIEELHTVKVRRRLASRTLAFVDLLRSQLLAGHVVNETIRRSGFVTAYSLASDGRVVKLIRAGVYSVAFESPLDAALYLATRRLAYWTRIHTTTN